MSCGTNIHSPKFGLGPGTGGAGEVITGPVGSVSGGVPCAFSGSVEESTHVPLCAVYPVWHDKHASLLSRLAHCPPGATTRSADCRVHHFAVRIDLVNFSATSAWIPDRFTHSA